MKKFSKKIYFWGLIAFAMVAIFSTAISTMAWFTLVSPPASSMVTGGADVNIESVTGYKVPEVRNSNGFIDYANDKVFNKEIKGTDFKPTENTHQEGEDLNFDVPAEGIGYYLLTPNDKGIFKFMADKSNYEKFTAYDYGDLLSLTMDLTTSTPFRIRSYQMKDHKTDLQTIDLKAVGGPATLDAESHEVTVTSNGNYKVWYDKVQQKIGVERLGDITLTNNLNPKRMNPKGGETIWLKIDFHEWESDYAQMVLYVNNASTNKTVTMTSVGDHYYHATVPTPSSGSWTNAIFVRADNNWSGTGSIWDHKWNQTPDLGWPSDPNNCITVTGWDTVGDWWSYNDPVKIKVGGGAYTAMTWDSDKSQWSYTISEAIDDGTTIAFEKYGNQGVAITKKTDGVSAFNQNNLIVSGGTYKIAAGGKGIGVYLGTDNKVWVSQVDVAKVTIGGNSYSMTYEDVGDGQWKYTATNVADATAISFTYSGFAISVSASDDSSNPWYNKNNFDGSKILGGGTVNIYLHQDTTVWVSASVMIRSGTGNWVQMSDNPDNENELCATGMTVTEGETVAIKANGTDVIFTAQSADLNNIGSDLKIIKSASGVGMYLHKTNKTLWVDGNKIYNLRVGEVDKGEMVYQSSGNFPGWYGITEVAIGNDDAISVRLTTKAGSVAQDLSAHDADDNNFNATTSKILRGGTVDVYFNTSGNALYITPVYWVQVGANDVNATLESNGEYKATFTNKFAGGAAVKAYMNATELSTYTADGDRDNLHNNCHGTAGNLTVIYDTAENGVVIFNTTTSKIYVDGYAPCYYVKVGSGSWAKMTDMNDDSQVKLAITASADTVLKFRKNAAGSEITATAKASTYLNNYTSGKVIDAIENKTIYFNYTNNELWVPGRHLTYHFYTEEGTPHAYLWEEGHTSEQEQHYNAAYPGVMMTDESEAVAKGVYSVDYVIRDDYVVNRLIFNLGSGQKQSVDIDISAIDGIGKYFYLKNETDTQGHYKYAYYANPPSASEDYTFYVHDPGTDETQKFGTDVSVYAWDSQGQTMPVAPYPGKPMTAIIPGSLWICKISNAYENMVFASSDGSNETADINNISQHDGGLFVATTNTSGTVTGAWATAKSSQTINAKIYIGDSTDGINMAIGDNAGSNKYIYEAGLQAKHGDTLRVVADGVTFSTSSNFVDDDIDRPYLDVTESSITVKLGSSSETARFNFYVTDEETPKLSIVMVPDLGNGFYIMPYQNSTEGFVAGKKMSSITSTSATYAGFYAKKDDRVFLRSYVDAVDKGYELDSSVDDSIATCDDSNKMIITFQKTAYFTIEISNNTVKIKEFTINEFLNLNPLDKTKASSQPAIKAMHTAMVFEVKYQVSDCAFAMTPILSVTNDQPNYIGVAASFTASPQTDPNPYAYMTDSARYDYDSETNVNGLTIRGSSFDLGDATFKTDLNNSTKSYYVYFLVDYVYSNNLASMPYGLNGRLSFHLKVNQA